MLTQTAMFVVFVLDEIISQGNQTYWLTAGQLPTFIIEYGSCL
jgi:hypothetical protein